MVWSLMYPLAARAPLNKKRVAGLTLSRSLPAGVLLAVGGYGLPAQAQDGPAAAAAGTASASSAVTAAPLLPEVTVIGSRGPRPSQGTGLYTTRSSATATRLDLSPRETPQSVSTVTRTQLEDFGLSSVQDTLSQVTGVNVERVETDRTYYIVRGFEVSNFLFDGVGLPFATGDQTGDVDTSLYDRVEIVRGANGLSSFTGNPAATVNFVRKRPTTQFQASGGLTLGSWNKKRVEGDVSGRLNESGSVRGRLVVAGEDRDSYLDRYSLRKHAFSGIVEADLAPGTLLTLGHTEQKNQPKGVMWGALPLQDINGRPLSYDRSASTAADWAYWTSKDVQTFAELSHRFGNGWRVKGTLTRRTLSSDSELFYVYGTPVVYGVMGEGLKSYPSRYNQTEKQWVADVHVSGPWTLGGRQHEVMAGFNWSRQGNEAQSVYEHVDDDVSLDTVFNGTFPKPAFNGSAGGWGDFADRRRTVFGAVRWNPADRWKIITGANVTQVKSDGEQYDTPHHYSKTKASPYLGVVHDLDANHSVYASHTAIFNPQTKLGADLRPLDPLTGTNDELGLKGEWFNKRLNGTLAVFRVKQSNVAEAFGLPVNGKQRYRGVDATSKGFELDVAGRIGERWDLSGGYTQLRMEDDEGEPALPYVPRRTLRLTGTYRLPAVPVKVGASLRWQDDTKSITNYEQPSYAVVDLMARYDVNEHVSLNLNLNNVGDRKYINSLYWTQGYYAAGRNGSVTLRWTY